MALKTTKNSIIYASIKSKAPNDKYDAGWERIWGKKKRKSPKSDPKFTISKS